MSKGHNLNIGKYFLLLLDNDEVAFFYLSETGNRNLFF